MCTAYFVLRIPCCVGRGAYTQYAVRYTVANHFGRGNNDIQC
jgi:hypothetical protein